MTQDVYVRNLEGVGNDMHPLHDFLVLRLRNRALPAD